MLNIKIANGVQESGSGVYLDGVFIPGVESVTVDANAQMGYSDVALKLHSSMVGVNIEADEKRVDVRVAGVLIEGSVALDILYALKQRGELHIEKDLPNVIKDKFHDVLENIRNEKKGE